MKKYIFLLLLLQPFQVFAVSGSLEVDTNEVALGDTFELRVSVNAQTDEQITLSEIPGLEHFLIQSSSYAQDAKQKTVVINGEVTQQKLRTRTVTLELSPKKIGNYTLGPVTLSSGETQASTGSVEVSVKKDVEKIVSEPLVEPRKNTMYPIMLVFLACVLVATLLALKQRAKKKKTIDEVDNNL